MGSVNKPRGPRRPSSAIPVGTQFSPDLINLPEFLAALYEHSGDKRAIQRAIWQPPVHRKRSSVPASHRTANLPLEAARQYGLLDQEYVATDLTRRLVALSGEALYEEFARHILLNCGGTRVLRGIEEMQRDRDAGLSSIEVTADSLARHLTAQGFQVTEHNTAINSMRMWLAEAGLFLKEGRKWKVGQEVKTRLLGLSDEAMGILAGLSEAQHAFVGALYRIDPEGWCKASEVRDLAEATYGVRLGRASLPKEALEPLSRAGLIEYRTGGTRGGKAAELRTTSEFKREVLEPFISTTLKSLDPELIRYYAMRPADIYASLNSSDKFEKGRSHEAYAIHIMRLLGLRFVEWRKRGPETGGAEIDAVFQGVLGCLPTVWQIQCKNVPKGELRLEDVSKEVGQVPTTRATHVLMISTGRITREAETFAMKTMRNNPLTIFLLAREDFEAIKASPGRLGSILREKADRIVRARTGSAD